MKIAQLSLISTSLRSCRVVSATAISAAFCTAISMTIAQTVISPAGIYIGNIVTTGGAAAVLNFNGGSGAWNSDFSINWGAGGLGGLGGLVVGPSGIYASNVVPFG